MAVNRFLSHTAFASLVLTTALAGCSSVETAPNKTSRLQTNSSPALQATAANAGDDTTGTSLAEASVSKTGRIHLAIPDTGSVADVQQAAMDAPEMAPQVAYATTNPVSATTAAVAIQSVASPASVDAGIETASIAPTTLGGPPATLEEAALTPDMQSLQAAIPIPRPDIKALAYASAPAAPAAVATLQAIDTRREFPPAPGDPLPETASASPPELTKLIKHYAGLYGIPESLVHRVVHRESRYNPKAYHKDGYWGLMQIKYATAKSMGYNGRPEGLLDAETNLKYAIKYLRGAWLVADNSNDNAIRLYARGYYYDAKRKGMLHVLKQ